MESGGAILIGRILAPPPPQTPQYYNYLNDREGAIIFLTPPMPITPSPTPQYLLSWWQGKGGGVTMGARRGGKRGHLPPPWKFKNMGAPTSITYNA